MCNCKKFNSKSTLIKMLVVVARPTNPPARNVCWWCNQKTLGLVHTLPYLTNTIQNCRPCPHGSFYSPKPYNTSLDFRLENILKSCTTSCWQSPHPTLNPSYCLLKAVQCLIFPNEQACGCQWEMGAEGVGALRETQPRGNQGFVTSM